jgi:hypothetical protein
VVEWLLEAYMLTSVERAARLVLEYAAGDSGFMIAYQRTDPYTLGFHFLGTDGKYIVWMMGYTLSRGESMIVVVERVSMTEERKRGFLIRFFAKAGQSIGIPGAENFARELLAQPTLWRFVSFVDGAVSLHSDNERLWQVLWGRLVEITRSRIACGHVPSRTMKVIIKKFQSCAEEGQIVLDQ